MVQHRRHRSKLSTIIGLRKTKRRFMQYLSRLHAQVQPAGTTSKCCQFQNTQKRFKTYHFCFKKGIKGFWVRHAYYIFADLIKSWLRRGYAKHAGIRQTPRPTSRWRVRTGWPNRGRFCIRHLYIWSQRGTKRRRNRCKSQGHCN